MKTMFVAVFTLGNPGQTTQGKHRMRHVLFSPTFRSIRNGRREAVSISALNQSRDVRLVILLHEGQHKKQITKQNHKRVSPSKICVIDHTKRTRGGEVGGGG